MPGITKIKISDREFKYYKQWVEETKGEDIRDYLAGQITMQLRTLKKQEGKCSQRSIQLQQGKYKGSCIWSTKNNCYKIYVRTKEYSMTYGFFSNLYSAERELQHLFENSEGTLWGVAKKQQKYYQVQHRLTTHPKLTDNTLNIRHIRANRGGFELLFNSPFINPFNNKQQKKIYWTKGWFKKYSKKQIIEECVRMDDPVQIIKYREELKQRLKELEG